ncbi:MAG: translational GTPase TypA [Spirochaetales bacterium]|nr:translational GTPase TypA [Spirochaetales bacterium]
MKHTHNGGSIRNIAIIAHVDHGKTTLVDAMFRQSGVFRDGQVVNERIMDSMDLERERGITIAAKNCSVQWKGVKINIIDTPGHADFGGEVERALSMADGALLLVDAAEGPLPQTRFVLSKALAAGLPLIVVINKIDRSDARPLETADEVFDLLIDLGVGDEVHDFPLLYAAGRAGTASFSHDKPGKNLEILFDTILEKIPAPEVDVKSPFRMLVSDLGYSDYLGRLAVGKIYSGTVKANDSLGCIGESGTITPLKVSKLRSYGGLSVVDTTHAEAGDILILAGIDDVHIGDTICTTAHPQALPRIRVDEPTVAMKFSRSSSPFAGKEGKYVQLSRIGERLQKETLRNVSIRVMEAEDGDGFIVQGRGEFQMIILIETLRREGFEFCVGRPEVILRHENGKKLEPIENLFVDCAEGYTGIVTEKISRRKGRLSDMKFLEAGRVRLHFNAPSRALIGYRDEFLTDTRGTGIMNTLFSGYEEYRGDFPGRFTGSLVSDREGIAVAYGLFNLEARGLLFITPQEKVFEGMIIGERNREGDLYVNPCRTKKLSNMRAAGKDDAVTLTPVTPMTLERAVQFLGEDELVEITPRSIRLRKAILSSQARKLKERQFA